MRKVEDTSRTAVRTAGRAGIGLAVAATAVGVGVPTAHAAGPHPGANAATQPRAAVPAATAPATAGSSALAPHHRPAPTTPTMTYRVVAGDTVSHIAARTGTSVGAIVRANNLGADALIRIGQMLRIPSAAGEASSASESPRPASDAPSSYTVRSGDTLSHIAARFDTSVDRLAELNRLADSNVIHIGQKLSVAGDVDAAPTPSAPGSTSVPARPATTSQTHTVVAGDTVSALAARYDTTAQAIIDANDLDSAALIFVGQKLTVGGSAPQESSDSSDSSGSNQNAASASYTVSAGDTVSAIATRFGVSAEAIVAANGLGADAVIHVGQKLVVPTSTNLVGDSFAGRTYPEATVASANANKAALLAVGSPSRAEMQAMVVQVATEMGVDPALAQATAYQESGFNHASVSPANAIGTMQVIPSSGEWASDLVGRHLNLLDPYDNVVAGVAIIRSLQSSADSLEQGIAGYYQGLGSVRQNGMYDDTKDYVAAIKAHMNRF